MRLLVPLDGSSLSEAILPAVAGAAGKLGADVLLFSVGNPEEAEPTPRTQVLPSIFPVGTFSGSRLNIPEPADIIPAAVEDREQAVERVEAELREYLAACAKHLPGLVVRTRVVIADNPAQAIIDIARDEDIDWIAMTTHGRSGIGRMLAGSVAEAVIRSGVAPVLVVHPIEPAPGVRSH